MSTNSDLGILVVAYGKRRYLRQARALARSIRIHSPNLGLALVTDRQQEECGDFDQQIVVEGKCLKGLEFKLSLFKWSPFDRTVFLDADSLCLAPIEPQIARYQGVPFAGFGGQFDAIGHWFVSPEACELVKQTYGMRTMPLVIGNLYYFEKNRVAQKVFKDAAALFDLYSSLGLRPFGAGINEEPLFSIALHRAGMRAHDLDPDLACNLDGAHWRMLEVDAFRGGSKVLFRGTECRPAILHFGAHELDWRYIREQRLLLGKRRFGCPRVLLSASSHVSSIVQRGIRRFKGP